MPIFLSCKHENMTLTVPWSVLLSPFPGNLLEMHSLGLHPDLQPQNLNLNRSQDDRPVLEPCTQTFLSVRCEHVQRVCCYSKFTFCGCLAFCLVTWATQEAGCRLLGMLLRSLGKMAPEPLPPLSRQGQGRMEPTGTEREMGNIELELLEVAQVLLSCPWTWTLCSLTVKLCQGFLKAKPQTILASRFFLI